MTPIVVTRSYEFPAERVFDAWLTPEVTRRWLFTTDDSEVIRCEIDARVGGKFEIVDKRDNGEFKGEIRSVGVPQFDPRMTRVEIDIVSKGVGCELTLTHHGVPEEWQAPTTDGWTKLLGNLARAVSAR